MKYFNALKVKAGSHFGWKSGKNTFELHDNLVPSVKNQIIKPLCVAFLCKVSDLKAYICVKMLTLLPVASMNHDVGE